MATLQSYTYSNPSLTSSDYEYSLIKNNFEFNNSTLNSELQNFRNKKTQLRVNGEINVNNLYVLPESQGSKGDVLSYPDSGNTLQWGSPGSLISTDDFVPSTIMEGDFNKKLANLTQIVGQTEVCILTLTNYDIADNIGNSTYTISRKVGDSFINETFNYYNDPEAYSSFADGDLIIELLTNNYYSKVYKITRSIYVGYESGGNSVVKVTTTGGLSASIVTKQAYSNQNGFDNDFVEIELKDYPYYPYTPKVETISDDPFINIFSNFDNNILCTCVQSDDKILIGGAFDIYDNYRSIKIIRLNSDTTIDKTFNIGDGFDRNVHVIKQQSDDKILIGGEFIRYNGVTHSRIIRLNIDGSVDTTFNTLDFNNVVKVIEIQPDGKILVGGEFTLYGSDSQNYLTRLKTDGSIDTTFNIGNGANGYVQSIKYLSIDKIFIGGDFDAIGGSSGNHLILLNSNGSLDTTFNLNGAVNVIEEQKNGRVLIGGQFTSFNGSGYQYFIRLLPYSYWNDLGIIDNLNGTTQFDDFVKSIKLQSDDKILVSGQFSQCYDRNNDEWINVNGFVRLDNILLPDLDFDFNQYNLYNASISIQSDNKIVVNNNNDNTLYRLYSGLEVKYFTPNFLGKDYDKIAVGSNSYLTFGGGSTLHNISESVPNLPGIFINTLDQSYQRVWTGVEKDDKWIFRIRYEGGSDTSYDMSNGPQNTWEITFYDIENSNKIDIRTGVSDNYKGYGNVLNGVSLIKSSNQIIRRFEAAPDSEYLLNEGYGVLHKKYENIKFNPGTTIETIDNVSNVNLPVAAFDWQNTTAAWGMRTYNGHYQVNISGTPVPWFNFSDIPGYIYSNLKGGIIEYHVTSTGAKVGTTIGSISFMADLVHGGQVLDISKNSSGTSENIDLTFAGLINSNPGSIGIYDSKNDLVSTVTIQWTSRLFFSTPWSAVQEEAEA
jgi:uncharacterized delta-60 repeat protein